MFSQIVMLNYPLFYGLIGLFSLLIGSLLNVFIYRLPTILKTELLKECECLLYLKISSQRVVNLFLPRSFCPACKQTIKACHNIPLLSFVWLRGRCYHCQYPIAVRYPFVEALSLGFGLLASWHFGFQPILIFALLFLWINLVMFFIDLEHQLLPDNLTLTLLWLGLIANTQSLFTSLPNAVLSAAGAYLFLWLFIQLFYWITGKIGMGHGDFKLFAAFGAWFGWQQLPFILFAASVTGAVIGLSYIALLHKPRDTPIPFGPFLCCAGILSLFYGPELVHWYLRSFSPMFS